MATKIERLRVATGVAAAACALSPTLIAPIRAASKVFRVGILGSEDSPPWQSFRLGLHDAGYVEGRNLVIEARWSQGFFDRLPALAADLVAQKVDVIVASGNQATWAAKAATSTIPIVMAVSGYPDKIGLVRSLSRPGGNITGLSNVSLELQSKRLELLKEAAPRVSKVGWLWSPTNPWEAAFAGEAGRGLVRAASVEVHFIEVRTPDDFSAAFAAASAGKVDALMALGNPVTFKGRYAIAEYALRNRLPSIFEERLFVEAGGLMSYAASFIELFRRAATYVDRILNGAQPAELPVEQPTRFELTINRTTAAALELTFPPSILLRTDRVVG